MDAQRTSGPRRFVDPWSDLAGVLALAMIAAQLVWRGVILHGGWFGHTDFQVLAMATDQSLGELVTEPYAGAFAPGAWLLASLQADVSPLGWGLGAAVTLVAEAAAAAVLWVVLTRLLGRRPLRLAVLAWFCFGPLTLWMTQWWSFAAPLWVATALLLTAVWATLVLAQDRRPYAAVLSLGTLSLALVFDDRLWFAPVLLVAVALVVTPGLPADTVRSRLVRLGRASPGWLIGLGAVLAVFTVVRIVAVPLHLPSGGESGDVATSFFRYVAAELWGGPWRRDISGYALVQPRSWAVAIGVVVLLALVATTLQRAGTTARVAWLGFTACAVAALGLTVLQSGGGLLASYGLVPRFAAELAAPFAVLVAGALRDLDLTARAAVPRRMARLATEPVVAVVAVLAVTASSAVSTSWLAESLRHPEAREYVANLRADLQAAPDTVLYDAPLPEKVMSGYFGEAASLSTIGRLLPEHPAFDLPSERLQMPDGQGRLGTLELEPGTRVAPPEDSDCGYHLTHAGLTMPLESAVPQGRWVLRVGYYTNVDSFANLRVGLAVTRFGVHSGLHTLDIPVRGPFATISADLDSETGTVCIADVTVGMVMS